MSVKENLFIFCRNLLLQSLRDARLQETLCPELCQPDADYKGSPHEMYKIVR